LVFSCQTSKRCFLGLICLRSGRIKSESAITSNASGVLTKPFVSIQIWYPSAFNLFTIGKRAAACKSGSPPEKVIPQPLAK